MDVSHWPPRYSNSTTIATITSSLKFSYPIVFQQINAPNFIVKLRFRYPYTMFHRPHLEENYKTQKKNIHEPQVYGTHRSKYSSHTLSFLAAIGIPSKRLLEPRGPHPMGKE